jgi:hypothetical protein
MDTVVKVVMKQCQVFYHKFFFAFFLYFCGKLSKIWLSATLLMCEIKFPKLYLQKITLHHKWDIDIVIKFV